MITNSLFTGYALAIVPPNKIMNAAKLAAELKSLSAMQQMIYEGYKGATDKALNLVTPHLTMNQVDAGIITTIFNWLLPLAYAIVVILFLTDLIERSTSFGGHNQIDEKFLLSALMKLLIAECLLQFGSKLISVLLDANNLFINQVTAMNITQSLINEKAMQKNQLQTENILFNAIKELNIIECLPLLMPAFVNGLASGLASLALTFQAVAKKIEIILMSSFSGLAMAGAFGDGGRPHALHYFKKFLACILHGASIILILKISDTIAAESLLDILNNHESLALIPLSDLLKTVVYKFAAIGSISVAKSIINDAIGS